MPEPRPPNTAMYTLCSGVAGVLGFGRLFGMMAVVNSC